MKKRWMFFFGFERSTDEDECDDINTTAIGYLVEPGEAVGEGWEQDHGPDEEERFGFHA